MTEERKDVSIEAVTASNPTIREGYQPLERKGYQPTAEPATRVPPQGISAVVQVATIASLDSNTTTPVAATTPQATSAPTPAAPPSGGNSTAAP